MFAKLFSSRRTNPEAPVASLPEGKRVYAIGDIHGRLDLLDALLAQIADDDAHRGRSDTQLLFLGDLIDRGPQSAQVVERLLRLSRTRPPHSSMRFLLGNHEEVFLSALEGNEKSLRFFTKIGGRETIFSYGISEDRYMSMDDAQLLQVLKAHVPPEHVEFLAAFEDMIVLGDYAFVHAGVRPQQPLATQRVKDLRWIRDEFLAFSGKLEKVIVHGHSITTDVELLPHRIGLDTGAYASDKLTAMGFEAGQRWILQT